MFSLSISSLPDKATEHNQMCKLSLKIFSKLSDMLYYLHDDNHTNDDNHNEQYH